MKKSFIHAAYAAKQRSNRGILTAGVNMNGTNPILAVSVITLVGVAAYAAKKYVDKSTRKEGGEV
jgi:hypothetical protein